jgi:hypothetical protein
MTRVSPDGGLSALDPSTAMHEIQRHEAGLPRRWSEGIAFVAIWMALGWGLKLDANAYLLIGVPLTIVFQLFIRRKPIRALWVREAPAWGDGWLIPATCLAILPAFRLIQMVGKHEWIVAGWFASAVAGAVGAGYALRHFKREAIRPFLFCNATAGLIGIGLMVAARAAGTLKAPILPLTGLEYFFLYFPVCFALEEVFFRGALDSHLHHPGDRFGITSAFLGSALWGLWHLPTLPPANHGVAEVVTAAVGMIIVHSLTGVPFAIFWRKSGNLVVPAFTHALIDAVRNALRLMG